MGDFIFCYNLLSYKVGYTAIFVVVAGQGLALEHCRHVATQITHCLHAFGICQHILCLAAVDHIPVAGGNKGHLVYGEVLADNIKAGTGAGSPGGDNGGAGLAPHMAAGSAEKSVQNGEKSAAWV